MNYSYFYKIEQDEWSLTRPTFPTPKGGELTVTGFYRKGKYSKMYLVFCDECGGNFAISRSNLNSGKIPCRCSKSHRPPKESREHVLRDMGFEGVKVTGTTFTFICPHCESLCGPFAYGRRKMAGCIVCESNRRRSFISRKVNKKDESYFLDKAKGILSGISYYDLDVDLENGNRFVKYRCRSCDRFVEGFQYQTQFGNLARGAVPCYCKGIRPRTPEWREADAKRLCVENGLLFRKMTGHNVVIFCPEHGEREVRISNLKHGYWGCPICAGRDQKFSYVNKVLDGHNIVAVKFGITSNPSPRLIWANHRNLLQMENISTWLFETSNRCKSAEKQCKKELECGILTKRELADGHTETTHIKNLDRIIEIYENHGGKRINTDEDR